MVDNAEFSVPMSYDVQVGDFIGMIYDDVDTNGLIGLWNFYNSVRDESGNDLHEENAYSSSLHSTSATVKTYETQTSNSKIYGKRSMNISAQTIGKYLKIPNKNIDGGSTSIVDFSNDFSITFWVTPSHMGNGSSSELHEEVIFDKYDDSTYKGIKIYFSRSSVNAYTLCVKVGVGDVGTVSIYTYDITTNDYESTLKHIALIRTNGVLKLNVDNTTIITETNTGDFTSTADIYLCKEYDESTSSLVEPNYYGLNCNFHQMKIYTRALSDGELSTHFESNVPAISMKFYGQVWKISDESSFSKCSCKGIGAIALNSNLNTSILSTDVASVRDKNAYKSGLTVSVVINDILSELCKLNFGSTNSNRLILCSKEIIKPTSLYTLLGDYIAEGSFIDILNELSILSQTTFMFMPTGILQMEKNNLLLTRGGIVLDNTNCELSSGGYDTSFVVNKLYGICRVEDYTVKNTVGRTHSTSNSWSDTTNFLSSHGFDVYPKSIISVTKGAVEIPSFNGTGTPSVNSYEIDPILATIRFFSTTSGTFTYNFTFIHDLNALGLINATSISYIKTDTTSIAKNGLFSKKISVPRLTGFPTIANPDITVFVNNYVTKNAGLIIPRRVTIKTSNIINHILDNNKINVYYATKNIGSLDGSYNPLPEALQIKKIEYYFPKTQTILELGDFLYDSFDLERESSENIRQIISNQTK